MTIAASGHCPEEGAGHGHAHQGIHVQLTAPQAANPLR